MTATVEERVSRIQRLARADSALAYAEDGRLDVAQIVERDKPADPAVWVAVVEHHLDDAGIFGSKATQLAIDIVNGLQLAGGLQ